MQIRVRGGRVECLRAEWDPAAKRSRQRIVKPEAFTAEEREQFDAWQAERQQSARQATHMSMARLAHLQLGYLAEALEAGVPLSDPVAVLAALDRVNRALRKAGITRPKKAKVEG